MYSFILCLMYLLIGTNGQKFPKDKKSKSEGAHKFFSLIFYLLKYAFFKLQFQKILIKLPKRFYRFSVNRKLPSSLNNLPSLTAFVTTFVVIITVKKF